MIMLDKILSTIIVVMGLIIVIFQIQMPPLSTGIAFIGWGMNTLYKYSKGVK